MKNIKEKAEEFAKENTNSLGYISQEHFDGFVAGASYVLEEIENVINADRILGNPFPTIIERLYTIMDTIKELKK